jgi:O-antigen/teichoic acid export membrane protein
VGRLGAWALVRRPLRDTTLRSAVLGGGWTLAGTLVGRVANVGGLLFAAHRLGSEQFGGLALALATVAVVSSVTALGLPVAAQKLVAEARGIDPTARDGLINATLGITVLAGTFGMAALFLLSGWVSTVVLGRGVLGPILAIAAVLVLSTPCVEAMAALLLALERFKKVGAYRALYGMLSGGLLVGTLLFFRSSVAAISATVSAETITCALGWWLLRRERGPWGNTWLSALRPAVRPLLRVAVPALLAAVSLQPALWLGQIVLSRQPGGLAEVGAFAVALRWQAIALFVPATMCSVLLPMLGRLRATGRRTDARALFVRYSALTLGFSALACGVLVVSARILMGLQGPEFAPAAPILAILGVAIVPTALNNVLSQRAVAEGRLALWVWSDFALAAALAAAAAALAPLLLGRGLALAYLVGYVTTCLVLLPIALDGRRVGREPSDDH